MQRIVIIGAGGQGREITDILCRRQRLGDDIELLGFIDDNGVLHGDQIGGVPVLGDFSWLESSDRESISVIVANGRPATTRRLAERARMLGFRFMRVVAPDASISPRAMLGEGVTVFPNAVVGPEVRIGDHAIVNVAATVSHDSVVGAYANINPGAHLAGNVTVGEGAFIGMGANVIQGRKVGAWSVVGAGAAVIRDIPDHSTAVGVPARVIREGPGE